MTAILDPRAAWLAERRTLVTASDAAAILGADLRRGPLAVYAEKLGVEIEETLPMRRGSRMEAIIAEEYAEQTGRRVENLGAYTIRRHPDIPWLGATLDRITLAEMWGALELKTALGSAREWKAGPPLGYLVQVQIQIVCYGSSWGALAALTGPGPLDVSDHRRNDAFLSAALPRLEEFRWRVVNRQPPPADASPGTTAAVKKLWEEEDGETVALDMETQALVLEMELLRAEAAKEEKRLDGVENELRRRLQSATFGALPDGSFLEARVTHRTGYSVEPTTYRALRRWWPKVRR